MLAFDEVYVLLGWIEMLYVVAGKPIDCAECEQDKSIAYKQCREGDEATAMYLTLAAATCPLNVIRLREAARVVHSQPELLSPDSHLAEYLEEARKLGLY